MLSEQLYDGFVDSKMFIRSVRTIDILIESLIFFLNMCMGTGVVFYLISNWKKKNWSSRKKIIVILQLLYAYLFFNFTRTVSDK